MSYITSQRITKLNHPNKERNNEMKLLKRLVKTLNKLLYNPHGYKVNQTHGVSLREGALGY